MSREPMWTLLILWLVRGGTAMSDTRPAPTQLPALPVIEPIEPIDPRTLANVEADITVARQIVAIQRAAYLRAWPSRETHNLCNDRLDYVIELNWLLDEWAALNASA